MIRIYQTQLVEVEAGETLNLAEIYCNSGDTKPTEGFANGSKLTEVDTGKTYLFDESNSSWTEVSAGGGGGGGGEDIKVIQCHELPSGNMNRVISPQEIDTSKVLIFKSTSKAYFIKEMYEDFIDTSEATISYEDDEGNEVVIDNEGVIDVMSITAAPTPTNFEFMLTGEGVAGYLAFAEEK